MAVRITVVGGDRREAEAVAELAARGHRALLFAGLPAGGVMACDDPEAAFAEAEAVVGPVLGTNAAGDGLYRAEPLGELRIDPRWLRLCRAGTPWLVGRAGPWLRAAAAEHGLPLVTYADLPEFALRNAVPTAEGAIAEAARRSGCTAWGQRALVVGAGRCGRALVQRLHALGCRVRCAARSAQGRAEAELLGAEAVPLDALPRAARDCGWVFNTVPAPVLGAEVLGALPSGALVLDLASAPGGTDFAAARALGVEAVLLPGIPGRMFPRTAGRIVAEVALEILAGSAGEGSRGGCV